MTERRRIKRRAQAGGQSLDWVTVRTEELNCVRVDVNKAIGRRGALYSFRLYRYERGRESSFVRAPHEAGDSMEAIRRANKWVDDDRRNESEF